MARRGGRRWEQVAIVLAILVVAACVYLLAQDAGDDGETATTGTTVPVVRQTTTTAITVPLAPGCAALNAMRAHQDATEQMQEVVTGVYLTPDDLDHLQGTIQVLDSYVEDELPAVADALGLFASDIPEQREGALLLQRVYVSYIRELEASDDSEEIISNLEGLFTRDDLGAVFTAIAAVITYDVEHCPQPGT